ncbi:hypothetical protein AACH10_22405 [Ideonella sp. DXS22W]|uniref:Uncharacterized protein n=1 Tax=Pseudaquabacterium inlustre TaxID=2984192 RepID=A0ABU9CMH7_9BURK
MHQHARQAALAGIARGLQQARRRLVVHIAQRVDAPQPGRLGKSLLAHAGHGRAHQAAALPAARQHKAQAQVVGAAVQLLRLQLHQAHRLALAGGQQHPGVGALLQPARLVPGQLLARLVGVGVRPPAQPAQHLNVGRPALERGLGIAGLRRAQREARAADLAPHAHLMDAPPACQARNLHGRRP